MVNRYAFLLQVDRTDPQNVFIVKRKDTVGSIDQIDFSLTKIANNIVSNSQPTIPAPEITRLRGKRFNCIKWSDVIIK